MRAERRRGVMPEHEASLMLAIALASLVTAAAAIAHTRAACPPARAVLLETLQPLLASPARHAYGAIERLAGSSAAGTFAVGARPQLRLADDLEIRGWAGATPAERDAAVFAVVDGGRATRAAYGAAPAGTLVPRADGRIPFDAVVPMSGLRAGLHRLAVRAVPREPNGYREIGTLTFEVR